MTSFQPVDLWKNRENDTCLVSQKHLNTRLVWFLLLRQGFCFSGNRRGEISKDKERALNLLIPKDFWKETASCPNR